MIEALLNRTVTIRSTVYSALTDDFSAGTTTAPVETETVGSLDQETTTETGDDLPQARWRLFLLPDENIAAGDSVVIDDLSYEVLGDPWPVEDKLSGQIHHLEVLLERTSNDGG